MVPFSTGGFHSPDSSASAKTLSPLLSDHVQGFHTSKLLTLKEELDCPKLLGLAALLAGWQPSSPGWWVNPVWLYQSLPLLRGRLWLCLSLFRCCCTKVWLKSRARSSAALGPLGDDLDSTRKVARSASWSDSDTVWPSGVTALSSGIEKSSTLTFRWLCARYMR